MLKSKSWFLAVLLIFIATAGHVTYRIGRSGGPMLVSMFAPGTAFPGEFITDAGGTSAADCKLFVVFASACPYCKEAAHAEAASTEQDRMPVTWLGMQTDSAEAAFGALLRAESRLVLASNTKKRLKIQAVPAAFLVDRSNVVREVWVYDGDESHADLRERCA